jgi:hypothetical protein
MLVSQSRQAKPESAAAARGIQPNRSEHAKFPDRVVRLGIRPVAAQPPPRPTCQSRGTTGRRCTYSTHSGTAQRPRSECNPYRASGVRVRFSHAVRQDAAPIFCAIPKVRTLVHR